MKGGGWSEVNTALDELRKIEAKQPPKSLTQIRASINVLSQDKNDGIRLLNKVEKEYDKVKGESNPDFEKWAQKSAFKSLYERAIGRIKLADEKIPELNADMTKVIEWQTERDTALQNVKKAWSESSFGETVRIELAKTSKDFDDIILIERMNRTSYGKFTKLKSLIDRLEESELKNEFLAEFKLLVGE